MFHVLNRGVARMQVFEKAGDYEAFERVLAETLLQRPMRICNYCLMPNHRHYVGLGRPQQAGRARKTSGSASSVQGERSRNGLPTW